MKTGIFFYFFFLLSLQAAAFLKPSSGKKPTKEYLSIAIDTLPIKNVDTALQNRVKEENAVVYTVDENDIFENEYTKEDFNKDKLARSLLLLIKDAVTRFTNTRSDTALNGKHQAAYNLTLKLPLIKSAYLYMPVENNQRSRIEIYYTVSNEEYEKAMEKLDELFEIIKRNKDLNALLIKKTISASADYYNYYNKTEKLFFIAHKKNRPEKTAHIKLMIEDRFKIN